MYQAATRFLSKFFTRQQIFKHGFNVSPMYRRSTGRVQEISKDLLHTKVKIPISYKNKNYVGSIFGGSLFAATDPIYMIQLINILGEHYVVWDKAATIHYKRPARQDAYAEFIFSTSEIEAIKKDVEKKGEITLVKTLNITNIEGRIFSELHKTLYIADKSFYKAKIKNR